MEETQGMIHTDAFSLTGDWYADFFTTLEWYLDYEVDLPEKYEVMESIISGRFYEAASEHLQVLVQTQLNLIISRSNELMKAINHRYESELVETNIGLMKFPLVVLGEFMIAMESSGIDKAVQQALKIKTFLNDKGAR